MADPNRFKVDDWVLIKKTKQKGVIADIANGKVMVRIPVNNSPYPSYAYVYPDNIQKVRVTKQPEENLNEIPDALF